MKLLRVSIRGRFGSEAKTAAERAAAESTVIKACDAAGRALFTSLREAGVTLEETKVLVKTLAPAAHLADDTVVLAVDEPAPAEEVKPSETTEPAHA